MPCLALYILRCGYDHTVSYCYKSLCIQPNSCLPIFFIIYDYVHSVVISIDPRNKGEWIQCVSLRNILPSLSEWPTRAHVGITASTGELSDNHDVISLNTYSDERLLEAHEAINSNKTLFQSTYGQPLGVRLTKYV